MEEVEAQTPPPRPGRVWLAHHPLAYQSLAFAGEVHSNSERPFTVTHRTNERLLVLLDKLPIVMQDI
jgi:hypothetical protein